jgi:predicted nucleotidyltransferase
MLDRILNQLRQIEASHDVRILFACESGSRAWGFASVDSDWDVRFLYVRRVEHYLAIYPPRDVIEVPISDELDVSGWDLQKALRLLVKSNPPLLEWIASPIQYLEVAPLVERLRQLRDLHFSPKSCMYHYLHMARGNFREYLRGESVRLKKYLYVLRPILACCWIESRGTMAPTEFATLIETQVDEPRVRAAIERLLVAKASATELGEGPRIPEINEFCEQQIARLEAAAAEVPAGERPGLTEVDGFFREALALLWSNA